MILPKRKMDVKYSADENFDELLNSIKFKNGFDIKNQGFKNSPPNQLVDLKRSHTTGSY